MSRDGHRAVTSVPIRRSCACPAVVAPGNPARERPAQVIDDLCRLVNPTGRLGIAGVYVKHDFAPAEPDTRHGRLRVPWGTLFAKGVTVGLGRTHDRRSTVRCTTWSCPAAPGPARSSPTACRSTPPPRWTPASTGGDGYRADALAGRGAKGHRLYDWAFVQLDHDNPARGDGDCDDTAGRHWLLVRRHQRTGELAFYRCWTPRPVPLATLVRVAGARWRIEQAFHAGKGLCGLDQHQVRRWRSWYRWTTLAMVALAFLVVLTVTHRARHPTPAGLVELTCYELQHLFAAVLVVPVGDLGHRLAWSAWRRRQQARARTCHYQRQATHGL
jgi:hypothetical protein